MGATFQSRTSALHGSGTRAAEAGEGDFDWLKIGNQMPLMKRFGR
jgi:hypothetical protein